MYVYIRRTAIRSARVSPTRIAVTATLGARIAYGVVMLVAPQKIGRKWLGSPADEPGGQVALRAVGGREVAVHGVALFALLHGRPVWPWLVASIGGDLTDVASTVAAGDGLPDGSVRATIAVGGGSALLTSAMLGLALRDD
jgi:hypothetical protein